MSDRLSPRRGVAHPLLLVLAGSCLAACGGEPPPPAAKAASISNPVTEASLTTVTLAADAERRLAIAVDTVALRDLAAHRTLPGEVVATPGMSQQLVAPVSGRVARAGTTPIPVSGARVRGDSAMLALIPIATDRDVARSSEELQVAEARLTRAQLEADRVGALWRDRLVSARDREVAETELAMALATRDAAAGRSLLATGERRSPAGVAQLVIRSPYDGVVRSLLVGEGQLVAAGTPLLEVVQLSSVWIRVPAYVGDLSRLDVTSRASVRPLGADASGRSHVGTPVPAPPMADAATASADLYYRVDNGTARLRPGERVQVRVPLRGAPGARLTIPWAAVVYDHDGGSWVYERVAERSYVRRRVALGEVAGEWAEVRSGIRAGALVVTAGAAELLGIEFGAGT